MSFAARGLWSLAIPLHTAPTREAGPDARYDRAARDTPKAPRAQLPEASEQVTTRTLGPEVQRTRRDQLRERPRPRARASCAAGAPRGHRRPAAPRPRPPL